LVPDNWSGRSSTVFVWGSRGGKRAAFGQVPVTPKMHEEVRVQVDLALLPCGAWCTAGAVECAGDAVATCQRTPEGCGSWGAGNPCPTDKPYCSFGVCLSHCIDECAAGESRCEGPGTLRTCGKFGSDPCLHWLPESSCPQGQACSNGACR